MNSSIIKIENIEIVPVKPSSGLVAFASFTIDNKFYMGSVAIYSRLDGSGYRLVYPSKRIGDKNFNIFHPIRADVGAIIEEEVSQKVNKLFNEKFYETTKSTEQ